MDNRVSTLEAQTYPESLRNLADVNMTPTIADDQKLISYDQPSDKFILVPPPNNFPEAPNTNQGYLRKTTAGVGSWTLLSADSEYSTTKNKVLTNEGNITVLQTDVSNLQTDVSNLGLDNLVDVDLTIPPTNGQVL